MNNDTADTGTDCPTTGGPSWHFVISPNNGDSYFITFHLNLGDATTYDTSVFVSNGSQLDNVFVEVPSGKTLTSLNKDGSTADIYWNGEGSEPTKFMLSHTCAGLTGQDLTVTKTANAQYTRTYGWDIAKAVDKTLVKQVGGTATFNYTVDAWQTGYTDSLWLVDGTITVTNPNTWDVTVDVTDAVDNGGSCDVAGGVDVVVPGSDSVTLDYECAHASAPSSASGTNTATATWDKAAARTPNDSASGSMEFTFGDPTTRVNPTINVTDTFAGALGTLTATDTEPFATASYVYSRTVPVPANGCFGYDNTATITETGQDASRHVDVCGPAKTGALTMGFWQNKNGQAIITAADQTALSTYLKGFAPFQDLNGTKVASYVSNVIKLANASGASMNAMLKAQMLATALDVYFSDTALGGSKIGTAPIGGVTIDLTKVCANPLACSKYVNTSSAFGGAESMTVAGLLTYAAGQSDAGGINWYVNVKATQELAKITFDAINNQVAFEW